MTYHCDKLCSCDACDFLRFALDLAASDPLGFARFAASPEPHEDDGFCEWHAARAANDPAKLAELLAMALRAREINVYHDDPGDDLRLPAADVFVFRNGINIQSWISWAECRGEPPEHQFNMPKARALLASIMSTSSCDECLRIVRGEHG